MPSRRRALLVLAALTGLMALPFPAFNMPMPPILNTLWFELHVALAGNGLRLQVKEQAQQEEGDG